MERSKDLWFPDGTIVLQAEQTRFKVFRGILKESSSVFADLLADPYPDGAELVEGCVVVELDDAVEDLTYFLRAIYLARCAYVYAMSVNETDCYGQA